MTFSARDRVDGFAALGVVLYLDDAGRLRARGPQLLIDAARPALFCQRVAVASAGSHFRNPTHTETGTGGAPSIRMLL